MGRCDGFNPPFVITPTHVNSTLIVSHLGKKRVLNVNMNVNKKVVFGFHLIRFCIHLTYRNLYFTTWSRLIINDYRFMSLYYKLMLFTIIIIYWSDSFFLCKRHFWQIFTIWCLHGSQVFTNQVIIMNQDINSRFWATSNSTSCPSIWRKWRDN